MQACYADDAVFTDAVFRDLNGAEVRAMWEMLIRSGRDMELEFTAVKADDRTGSAKWTATYTFSKTGRQVVNRVRASFEFDGEGRISRHTDSFSFYAWARQALGPIGVLAGWLPSVRRKVREAARQSLREFMAKQG